MYTKLKFNPSPISLRVHFTISKFIPWAVIEYNWPVSKSSSLVPLILAQTKSSGRKIDCLSVFKPLNQAAF